MQIERASALLSVPPKLRYAATSDEETLRWADRIRTTVRRHLDPAEIRPLQVKSSSSGVRNGLRFENYEFTASGRGPFCGTLLLPAGGTKLPAVLVCPGRNADLHAVTGASSPDYPDRNVAEQLANQGFATLTLDYGIRGGFDPAIVGGRDEVTMLGLAIGLAGHSLLGLLVQDALCGLAWLARHSAVDAAKLGVFGHSLGAHIALHAALAHHDPLPAALASFMGSYPSIFVRQGDGGSAHALPGICRLADLPDLVAALVPNPLQIQIGSSDLSVPFEEARMAANTPRQSYENAKSKERLEVHVSSMGHGTDIPELVRFFNVWLRTNPIKAKPRVLVPAAKVHFDLNARKEIAERIDESLATGSLTLGRYGLQFEELAGRWTDSSHVVALNSGTSALEVALRIVNVQNRTVLIPANTFFATALAAIHAGASVRFVDIELDGLGMDPDHLRRELDRCPDAAAVVVVHMGGIVAPSVHKVLEICQARELPLIEDAAHALGSTLNGAFAGSIGDMASFSMYPTKIATSGEGGFLTCKSAQSANTARLLRDQGKDSFEANIHSRLGYNWRMSEPHAGIGIAHLERLGQFLEDRRKGAAVYDALLRDVQGVAPFDIPRSSASNYYKYIAMLPDNSDRETLKAGLKTHGVQLSGEVYQIPCCAQPYFRNAFPRPQFPRAYEFCRRHICLPLFSTMTEEQQKLSVDALKAELPVASAAETTA